MPEQLVKAHPQALQEKDKAGCAACSCTMRSYARRSNMAIVRALINALCESLLEQDSESNTPLHLAVMYQSA